MSKSKWYKTGFDEAVNGAPSDPPMNPGNRDYVNYCEGYRDGERQVEADQRADQKAADRVDGFDRDDLGESPDY